MLRPTLAFLAGAALLAGCPAANDDDSAGTSEMAITLDFAAKVGTADVVCGGSYEDMGAMGTTVQIKDFRAYISRIRLRNSDGDMVPLELDQDTPWQHEDLALIDFEDGTGACAETGTAETNMTITGTVPEGTYDEVEFDLGVPFGHNHGDSATAPSPLNLVSMQWNWQGGYKFVRIDMANEGAPPMNNWFFHLGSTGCESDASSTPPQVECAKPNRPTYSFQNFDHANDTLVLDLAGVLDDVDVSTNTLDTPPGCMSFPADVDDCVDLFPNLGLDWDSGECSGNCGAQSFIRVE